MVRTTLYRSSFIVVELGIFISLCLTGYEITDTQPQHIVPRALMQSQTDSMAAAETDVVQIQSQSHYEGMHFVIILCSQLGSLLCLAHFSLTYVLNLV
jgi:hypothetical protein